MAHNISCTVVWNTVRWHFLLPSYSVLYFILTFQDCMVLYCTCWLHQFFFHASSFPVSVVCQANLFFSLHYSTNILYSTVNRSLKIVLSTYCTKVCWSTFHYQVQYAYCYVLWGTIWNAKFVFMVPSFTERKKFPHHSITGSIHGVFTSVTLTKAKL